MLSLSRRVWKSNEWNTAIILEHILYVFFWADSLICVRWGSLMQDRLNFEKVNLKALSGSLMISQPKAI